MADGVLQVKISKELIQDMMAFHGINVITELKEAISSVQLTHTHTHTDFLRKLNSLFEPKKEERE